MKHFEYKIIYSKRKSIALQIKDDGMLLVRAPFRTAKERIEEIISNNKLWIEKRLAILEKEKNKYKTENVDGIFYMGKLYKSQLTTSRQMYLKDDVFFVPPTFQKKDYMDFLKKEILSYTKEKASFYAHIMNVKYKDIRISKAKSYWGCYSPHNKIIRFSLYLMLCPAFVIDYVVVHELCHIVDRFHSRQFYELVETYYKDYKAAKKWLRENKHITSFLGA